MFAYPCNFGFGLPFSLVNYFLKGDFVISKPKSRKYSVLKKKTVLVILK